MVPFDPSMFPHRVVKQTESDGSDPMGGVVEGFAAGPSPLPCRVRSTVTRQGIVAEVETSRTEARAAFPADPGVAKGDRLERVGDGLILRVLAPARARDGDGSLFVVECEVED